MALAKENVSEYLSATKPDPPAPPEPGANSRPPPPPPEPVFTDPAFPREPLVVPFPPAPPPPVPPAALFGVEQGVPPGRGAEEMGAKRRYGPVCG